MAAGLGLPGDLVEDFVHAELVKYQSWSDLRTQLMHYRTSTGVEVDFVLENRRGDLVGIERPLSAARTSTAFVICAPLQRQWARTIVVLAWDLACAEHNEARLHFMFLEDEHHKNCRFYAKS